jgi:hypothetical protein
MHSYEFVADNGFKVRNASTSAETVVINPDGSLVPSVVIGPGSILTTNIADANVTLTKLAAGITPSHVVKYAGKITWSGSGASLATTVTGVLLTDIVLVTIQTAPTQAAYIVSAAPTADTITITLSAANTSNNAVIAYQVLRAAA